MPFNDFLTRLFGFGNTAHSCSTIRRSGKQLSAYKQWVAAKVYLNWTGPFFKAYHYKKCNISSSPFRVQIINESNLQGAILFYDPVIGAQNFTFLFDLLNERVQQLGYKLHSADTRQICHKRYQEQIERYVLTPPAANVPGTDLCNQLYGNIHIDSVVINKLPGYIRFVANTYTDPYFSKPLPFMELLKSVLQPNEEKSLH
ncbi:hypothetical protein ABID22_002941 [Pontibacter aydingkolensis]|uniref:Uncharacterized protein n=1 Tax=Pontibacter aydingkolensis TaxID=1911536 RepID=A0ABS7CXD3_9BACT|nr:hypothetical protein [Pontibacter aydingkolensis]MBW7468524.1 hypothetical protein [Pontibacter aydingkolensis]